MLIVKERRCEHRRSQGVQWVHLHPQGGEKKFRRNLQEKFVSAPPAHQVHPQAEKESILGRFFAGGGDLEVYLVDLDRFLRATTKERPSTFLRRKEVHPRQNPGYAYGCEVRLEVALETL